MVANWDNDKVEGFSLVILPKHAYLTIAKHVLSHANPTIPKDEWCEAMGLLAGRIIAGNVEVSEAVPFTEGGHDDVAFDYSDYVRMASLESEYNVRDPPEFFVGWYHSHFIGHTFSGIDIHNHLGWQNNLNPYAFGLVFDPQLISEENPGFCCIKLEDPSKEQASALEYLDQVIQIPKKHRYDYEAYLKSQFPECF